MMDRRPLFASEIVAVKALTTTLCVFQLSTQEVGRRARTSGRT